MMRFAKYVGILIAGLLTLVEVALSVGISLAAHTDHQFLIVTGGSMEPTYDLGSGLLLKNLPPEDVTTGTVVTYRSVEGTLTTHRVIDRTTIGKTDYIQTQGDANPEPDPNFTAVDAVIGTPVLAIPYGGYAATFLLSGLGRFLVFCPPLLMLLLVEIRMIRAYFAKDPVEIGPDPVLVPPTRDPHKRFVAAGAMAVVLAASMGAGTLIAKSAALFVAADNTTANAFDTDILAPATGLSVTTAAGINTLTWNPTTSTYATGYTILRADNGGPLTPIGSVTGRATTTYNDPAPSQPAAYAIRAHANNWTSADTDPSPQITPWLNTGWTNCAANAADTGGDNNGYQTAPGNACGNPDNATASDPNSGTGAVNSCTDASKDRHRYFNYNLAVPVGGVIGGIEVQTIGQHNRNGIAGHCIQLSGDGGTTWTTPQSATYPLHNTPTTLTYGSPTALWGTAWDATKLNNTNFRVRIINLSTSTNRTLDLDSIQVRVTYR